MKLSHLLVMIGLSSTIMLTLTGIVPSVDRADSTAFVVLIGPVMVLSAFLAGPIARCLHLSPFTTLWGPCPGCGRRPSGWWSHPVSRDFLQLDCGECGQRVDLWLIKPSQQEPTADDVPTYTLRHPRFIGLWRRMT